MSRSRSFSTSQLQARLRAARGEDPHKQLSLEERYAGLAALDLPENPDEFLGELETWPCDLYSAVDPRVRQDVLEWLIENVEELVCVDEEEFAWREQWQFELLRFVSASPEQIETLATSLEKRGLTTPSRKLYYRLVELNGSSAVTLSWLRHLTNAEAWSEVIDTAETALGAETERSVRSQIYMLLVDGLLERREADEPKQSDAERALHTLFAVRSEGLWGEDFGTLLDRSTEDVLPCDLKAGRGEPTNLLADAYRGLSRLGKWLGKALGGRDAQVPYSEGVVNSAPAMLVPAAVEKFLSSSKKHGEEFHQAVAAKGEDAEAAAVAGTLSVGGFWTLAQIDDTVLKAMTFSSAGNPDSFWRLREIARGYEDSQGAITRLSGYVAEQQVAVDLTREGHVVEFPEGPTEPGWDLLVDGHPVQVKCSMDLDYVLDHFERYPEIPVVVNTELAQQLGDHPMVWVDQGLSHAEVASTTEESVDALADFADADDLIPIPIVSVAFAAVRNFGDLRAGQIDEGTFAQRVGVDVAARTVGGGAGSLVGGAVGSFLGPVGTVVGASIGGFIGSIAGGTGADAVNRDAVCDARDAVVSNLGQFAAWFRSMLLRPRIAFLQERHDTMASWALDASSNGWAPACVATFYSASTEMLARAKGIDSWIAERESGDDFARAHAGWVALREAGGFFHPELKTRLAAVQEAMRAYCTVTNPAPKGAPSPATA